MIHHLSTYTTKFEAARAFYDAALKPLGAERMMDLVTEWDPEFPNGRICAYGPPGKPALWLIEKREARTQAHFAFAAKSKEAVQAFYDAALKAGGKDNGAPGPRAHYSPTYYGAFILDPDGNNIEAVVA